MKNKNPCRKFESIFVGNEKIVKTLIKNGARTNVTDSDGDSALMKVAAQGKPLSWYNVHSEIQNSMFQETSI